MLRMKLLTAAAATALLAAPAAFAQTAPEPAPQTPPAPAEAPAAAPAAPAPAAPVAQANNVIDVLKAKGEFSTLLSALDQAQLTEVLSTRPAITIFAPTDAAFAALPEADRTRLMDPANIQELRTLLLYHVIVADVTTAQIEGARGPVATAGGSELLIDGAGDGIKVDTATVLQAEIDASNGGVFAIDKVLSPAGSQAAQGDAEASAAAAPAPAPAETVAPDASVAADGATRPAAPGENAPTGEPAAAVTTTAAPPVPNPTDGQVDDAEDPANPAPTPAPAPTPTPTPTPN